MQRTLLLALSALTLAACGTGNDAERPIVNLSWTFEEARMTDDGQPFSNVTLHLKGATTTDVSLGEYPGTCSTWNDVEMSENLPDALAAARCWWAGSGDDFVVTRVTPGTLQVTTRGIDEANAENPEAYGSFVPLVESVQIPENTDFE